MIPLSLEAVASAVGGRLCDVPDPSVLMTAPAVVDSREVEPGGLFAALPGEHADGHAFAANAVKAGAVAVLAARPVGVPAVVVDDVLDALAALARTVLAAVPEAMVIGLTGSAGKTSTKDLIAQVLPELGETIATVKSFNGEIGMPLTVTHLDQGVRYIVLEMGARGIGHISHLTRIAPPTVGLVLNVGTAHVGEFGGREQIAKAKGELVEALPADGLAVLNADDPLVAAMASRTRARVLNFGIETDADVRALDVALDPSGRASFTLAAAGTRARVDLSLHGVHHVSNALGAAAVAIGLGAGVEKTAAALSRAVLVASGRMEVTDRPDGVRIINDAFNANPDSMKAAFTALAAMADGHRTIAVLGEMKELGADAGEEHRQVGRLVAAAGIHVLIAVGDDDASAMAAAAQQDNPQLKVVGARDRDHALTLAGDLIEAGDIVLVKGSHSVELEHTAERLAQPGPVTGDR
ncbi:UDP-N-acetylmuramoyl-tripeptide--D-alanyl-D-alanine ligase (plasmid) [Streptomyces sp. NBC_00053]|uniref:UDP-N-acetylmuramoyl-tripeptide--D-alanyl-D- alanine ligase n=1 Tax=unclassified Streptomyces TaxID=2593676 RepID=UPI002251DFFF|nr:MULTISPECIES: UDP-N-acetylmuramoyl-tripeptide--D-alanyl-D-alanine ligase [unclassified Streptomyces]MCX4399944.1 UDP-N-acetylmuramoyl-tripeptide--D-alanyl-D-alanine ligase [Streptomyces sp. NBC_01767]MCX5506052.1 UDP-N-acetylmuramoyl-tripeptide--D-alanyl-D-alanine ligase [Streptomyces sp. NBC_00052]MCX5554293.1 UDP-N-acetylmuramoyl-tripeptide--D-alanyl-D-alanine ligase [Streptomyces sp. NBC_00051]WSP52955.1 UDP-N-acetylmuramoyl-tripeptide--D-alanyl-D-alanine ligase [Streptomyces sp. NBC_0124